ncbi:glycosyltransferase family 2 protein [Dyadobacter aurulentus]|uniref:glycosyltransferase family 2 protein n=1 Tax=Dyadobacter sp. UC 10 TaxID=2605428 RepID=UPI001CED2687|nr:glycosyltransferase family 2 protein [Dyadobacter sp. UC 10]
MPEISIALCTYNGQDFLPEQLDSILNQSVTDWEIVVIDDCSTDQTWSILEKYAAADTRFRLYRNDENLGYNKNFEKALMHCKADLIAICDQDDIWHPDKLSTQIEAMEDHQLVYHDSEFIAHSGEKMHIRISDKFNFYRGNRPEPFIFLNCASGHSIMMRSEVVANAIPFPDNFHYDQWLAFVAASNGTIDYLKQPLVQYRQHRKNNTDMLALNSVAKSKQQKIAEMEREKEWLRLCLNKTHDKPNELIAELYAACRRRNASLLSISYAMIIWKNRDLLLYLLKKPETSKFFFTLRKMWGIWAKKLI